MTALASSIATLLLGALLSRALPRRGRLLKRLTEEAAVLDKLDGTARAQVAEVAASTAQEYHDWVLGDTRLDTLVRRLYLGTSLGFSVSLVGAAISLVGQVSEADSGTGPITWTSIGIMASGLLIGFPSQHFLRRKLRERAEAAAAASVG